MLNSKDILQLKRYRRETKKGIYFLINGDEIVYVGKSENIVPRIAAHGEGKIFDSFSYIEIEKTSDLLKIEMMYIQKLRPKYNKFVKKTPVIEHQDADNIIMNKFRKG